MHSSDSLLSALFFQCTRITHFSSALFSVHPSCDSFPKIRTLFVLQQFGCGAPRRRLRRRAATTAGGGDDVALAATRAGVGWRDESGHGVEENAVMTAVGMSLRRVGAVDDATTGGGGRTTRSVLIATEDDDDGWDLPPPPARRRRMRRCRCPLRPTTETTMTTRVRDDATQQEGGGHYKGRERSVA